jgi:tRNA threonylcarbamoyl adenosine modification protein (Sua5/YciO/YrdC/YwlC family)
MLIQLHPDNPQPRGIKQAVDCLMSGGVIIYPTDTIYGLGCDIFQPKAIEKICAIKNIQPEKAQFSFICSDLSHLSDFTKSISTPMFRLLKAHLPGPFTFILPAGKQVPKLLQTKKSTIGIRVPDNKICLMLLEQLGHPIISTSLPGEWVEDYTDPELMQENFGNKVDMILDGGIGGITPSTVVDYTGDEPIIVRQGAGILEI